MMYVKQRESKLFYNFSLSNRVPKDHFLCKIEEAIDFSFIHELARSYYSHTGQPGIDPVVLLKMMLIGYFYDITSERKLAQELRVNMLLCTSLVMTLTKKPLIIPYYQRLEEDSVLRYSKSFSSTY